MLGAAHASGCLGGSCGPRSRPHAAAGRCSAGPHCLMLQDVPACSLFATHPSPHLCDLQTPPGWHVHGGGNAEPCSSSTTPPTLLPIYLSCCSRGSIQEHAACAAAWRVAGGPGCSAPQTFFHDLPQVVKHPPLSCQSEVVTLVKRRHVAAYVLHRLPAAWSGDVQCFPRGAGRSVASQRKCHAGPFRLLPPHWITHLPGFIEFLASGVLKEGGGSTTT